jgi:hypothetical protein
MEYKFADGRQKMSHNYMRFTASLSAIDAVGAPGGLRL